MNDREMEVAVEERLSVPLWPHAGRALGLSRTATFAAANAGEIVTLDISRKRNVPTSWLRQKLGLERE